ncbi:preprotein translocase subunit SecG [Paroceanicella profunda]|uniref:Protein-export membrane protein SecG n=1 Tax=Paroceanicella profunda TaxID=2579971 RepID=A0A5B8FGE9_9RHOB|nr:preprotein translocase subunit SecG [Paroceanicella profunda]QDL90778.1 preprotein translocase subunit SecG [Paroceanicella profunda]
MENVILTVHLIIAVFLIGIVLLQRSEGGALGMGGGGGGGLVSSRGAATALSKVTWGLAAAFIVTSVTLTILAASHSSDRSVLDTILPPDTTGTAPQIDAPAPVLPPASGTGSDQPLAPPPAE